MTLVKKIFFWNDINIKRKSVIWNFIASMLNAAISAYMLMIVTRFIGVKDGGIFSIDSNMFSTVSSPLTSFRTFLFL